MGRKRLPPEELKVPVSLKIRKQLLDDLRAQLEKEGLLITHFFEESIKKYLKK